MKQLKSCAAIPCSAKIQISHSAWYRGKYNGKRHYPLVEELLFKTPLPKILYSTWGGRSDIIGSYTGECFRRYKDAEKPVYELVFRGWRYYWAKSGVKNEERT